MVASPGESMWVILNHVKADKRQQFEKFVYEILLPALEEGAKVDLTSKKIIEYCGLDWDENCLIHYKTKRVINTLSQWQARQPIYNTSKERWRNYEKYFPELVENLKDLK